MNVLRIKAGLCCAKQLCCLWHTDSLDDLGINERCLSERNGLAGVYDIGLPVCRGYFVQRADGSRCPQRDCTGGRESSGWTY